jgi:hypothetical protein
MSFEAHNEPLQPVQLFTLLNVEERRTRMQYRPDGILLYNAGGRDHSDKEKDKEQLQVARKMRYQGGELSSSAQRNLIRGFDNLMMVSKSKQQYNRYIKKNVSFSLAMITLTLPTDRMLSSKEMNKRLLKRFLQMIEDYSLRHHRKKLFYLWKLELQERGQLHWHIILNQFIPKELVIKYWSYLLNDTGLSREYFKNYGSRTVKPATKIESVKKNTAGELRTYMLKRYLKKRTDKAIVSKRKDARQQASAGKISTEQLKLQLQQFQEICSQIDGNCWGCSDALKEKYPSIEIDFSTYMRMKDDNCLNPGNYISFEFCMLIQDADKKPPDKILSPKFKAIIRANRDYIEMGGANAYKKYSLN